MLSRLILMLVIGVPTLGLIACGEKDTQGGEGLKFSVNGEVAPGQDVELRVIFEDTDIGVQNAVLTLNGKVVGRTDKDGRITISIPADATNVNIVASSSGGRLLRRSAKWTSLNFRGRTPRRSGVATLIPAFTVKYSFTWNR